MCLLGTFFWFILTFIQRVFWYSDVNFYTGTLRTYNLLLVFSYSWALIVHMKVVLITQCVLATLYREGETYILFYYLSRLNNSPIFKLEKGKPIALAESCAHSSESNTDLCRSCRSTSATWRKTETFFLICYRSTMLIS